MECLDFSCDGKFLASLGGESCNTLVLWSVEERKALCGTTAALETAKCLAFYNNSPNMLVSGMFLTIVSARPLNSSWRSKDCCRKPVPRISVVLFRWSLTRSDLGD